MKTQFFPSNSRFPRLCAIFFFNDTATTEIYTLSLHDALPISPGRLVRNRARYCSEPRALSTANSADQESGLLAVDRADRKSTRLNSSHQIISYAVFCLKKKKHNHVYTAKHDLTYEYMPNIPLN